MTIAAGQSTETFTVAASRFQQFAAGTMVEAGTLTAAVQDVLGYDLGSPASVDVALVTPGRTARDESDLAGIRRWLVMAKQSRYSHEGREHRQMRVDIDSGQVDFGRCAVDVSVNVEGMTQLRQHRLPWATSRL